MANVMASNNELTALGNYVDKNNPGSRLSVSNQNGESGYSGNRLSITTSASG